MKRFFFFLVFLAAQFLYAQGVIDITVKGISDGANSGAQKDREEAILDAKRQACEKAGVVLESKTTVKNFQLMSDYIETQSKAVLLPGFQVVDVGYVADGTYQVVLSGKIKTKEDEVISVKELRYAKSLNDRGEYAKCRAILENYIDSKDEKTPEEIKEQAQYCYLRWGYAFNPVEEFEKFTAYYPNSNYAGALKGFLDFAQKPLCSHAHRYSVHYSQWRKQTVVKEGKNFDRAIPVVMDTIVYADFKNAEHTLLLEYTFLQSTAKDAPEHFAYVYSLAHVDGNLKKAGGKGALSGATVVFEDFRPYAETENLKYHASRSDIRFGNFLLSDYLLEGEVPTRAGEYPQKTEFTIRQIAF